MSKASKRKGESERALPARWSVPVKLADVPETGLHRELDADVATRAAIAQSAGLAALPRLQASFDLTRRAGNGLHVVGRVLATVSQVCVVTLDPVENQIEEAVDLVFIPGGSAAGGPTVSSRNEELGLDEEAPEPLINETVDLGGIATEFLMLGIDPYPRKPEALFEAPAREEERGHPFAALAALQHGRGNRDE